MSSAFTEGYDDGRERGRAIARIQMEAKDAEIAALKAQLAEAEKKVNDTSLYIGSLERKLARAGQER